MRSLIWIFAGRICAKIRFLTSWFVSYLTVCQCFIITPAVKKQRNINVKNTVLFSSLIVFCIYWFVPSRCVWAANSATLQVSTIKTFHDKYYMSRGTAFLSKIACAHGEDSDQPAHPRKVMWRFWSPRMLIWDFAGCTWCSKCCGPAHISW